MKETDKNLSLFRKILIVAAICSAIVCVCVSLFNGFGLWDKLKDVERIRNWIESKGRFAVWVYAALVLCSVIFLPRPSTLMNYLATVLFKHAWVTFLVTSAATILGSIVCFWLGKVFGRRLAYWLIGREKTEKYSEIVNRKGKTLFVMMLLLPFFPDDVICIVAGISGMSFSFFSLSVVLARPVMIAAVTFLGRYAPGAMDTWGIPVTAAVVAVVIVSVIIVAFRRDRKLKSVNGKPTVGSDENNVCGINGDKKI